MSSHTSVSDSVYLPEENKAGEVASSPSVSVRPVRRAKKTPNASGAPSKIGRVKRAAPPSAPEEGVEYQPEFCERLLSFFDVPPFKVTEVMKRDGSVSLVETAAELPTFAAFARSLGVTQRRLMEWEEAYPAFACVAQKARDLQGDILIQNSLRGNYSSSFAVFTAKNILGWSDSKDDAKPAEKTLVVKWEK